MNLKDKIQEKLEVAGVNHRFIPLPQDLAMDIASHVRFHRIEMKDAVPTIIYRTEKGLIAAQRRADMQIDLSKLKKLAGVKSLAFASKSDLESLGTEVGLVPLTGLDILYFVDKRVLELPLTYGGGGIKTFALTLVPQDLIKLNSAHVSDFTYFERSKEMLKRGKQRILSGITPSGDGSLHIGNYLGAVKQFIELAKTHECFLMVADLHALTTVQNKEQLKKNTETLILNELSLLMGELGESLPNVTFFRQSDVPMHTELQSILNNVTPLGLLKRAHAYKDKLAKDMMEDDINVGLFSYPMLMAADILLYKPDLVPVGKDQKQHVEITRDIAERFNKIYKKNVFKLPEAHIPEEVAVILGTDGKRKMSKSLGNIISIFESEEVIKKQVMSTYTDPTRVHANDPGHIEGNMVFAYLDFLGRKSKVGELKQLYIEGKIADVEVKNYLFESLMQTFEPARKVHANLKNDPQKVKQILEKGAEKVRSVASQTMTEVREGVGLTNKYSFFGYSHSKPSLTGSAPGVITIDDFARVEQRVGKVIEAINVEKSEKLIRLVVDFGELGTRVMFTGVRPFGYTPEDFLNKQFLFVVNLAPRRMMNEESQGMILAVDGADKPIFVTAEGMPMGSKVR